MKKKQRQLCINILASDDTQIIKEQADYFIQNYSYTDEEKLSVIKTLTTYLSCVLMECNNNSDLRRKKNDVLQ